MDGLDERNGADDAPADRENEKKAAAKARTLPSMPARGRARVKRARTVTLKIPDDEVSRPQLTPSAPPAKVSDYPGPPPLEGPLVPMKPMRIISIESAPAFCEGLRSAAGCAGGSAAPFTSFATRRAASTCDVAGPGRQVRLRARRQLDALPADGRGSGGLGAAPTGHGRASPPTLLPGLHPRGAARSPLGGPPPVRSRRRSLRPRSFHPHPPRRRCRSRRRPSRAADRWTTSRSLRT